MLQTPFRKYEHTGIFSLDTWCEKGQVPSVFLHVPRTNLVHTATLSGSWM